MIFKFVHTLVCLIAHLFLIGLSVIQGAKNILASLISKFLVAPTCLLFLIGLAPFLHPR